MKKIAFFIIFALLPLVSWGYQQTKDLNISAILNDDGSIHVCEVWNVSTTQGTEWYLDRSLTGGEVEFLNLKVTENGKEFVNEGEWDVDRSLEEKAGKCGIVSKSRGCEICWGLGSYGDHIFSVEYDMTNSVRALNDYDAMHIQFVQKGLSAPPAQATITISIPGVQLDTCNAGIWGFGTPGQINFEDGKVVARTEMPMEESEQMIILLRLDKGLLHPAYSEERDFQEKLDEALEGADGYEEETLFEKILFALLALSPVFAAGIGIWLKKREIKNLIGVTSVKKVDWARTIPYEGDLLASDWVLRQLGIQGKQRNTVASAMILRMFYKGSLKIVKIDNKNIDIHFTDKGLNDFSSSELELYQMMKEASGEDVILQKKEFSKWSRKSANAKRVYYWGSACDREGRNSIAGRSYFTAGSLFKKFNDEGQAEARTLVGLRKYLKEFTLMDEKGSIEAATWKEYLVFGALFGIADQVAKELKDINAEVFEEVMEYDYNTFSQVLYMTDSMSRCITNANMAHKERMSSGGFASGGGGGGFSVGGGGGFSSGGCGGGCR